MPVITRLPVAMLLAAVVIYIPSTHASPVDSTSTDKLQAAAERGSVPSELELAANYLEGNGVAQDATQAAHWYEKAAQNGDSSAQNQIGFFYQAGIGVPVDYARALRWYQLSAASGYVIAKVNLGVMYTQGLGVPPNIELAIRLFEDAVQKGNGTAAAYLGDIYYLGLSGSRDLSAADKWYGVGIKMHDPLSAFDLGSMFSVDPRHPHDIPTAAGYLRRSVDGGYVPAMQSLGMLLINHPEVEQTADEAKSLLVKAAGAGQWRSSVMLGILARDGKNGPVDLKAALYHFRVAALQGGDDAERLLEFDLNRLSTELKPKDFAEQTSAAGDWYAMHRSPQLLMGHNASRYFPEPQSPDAVRASVSKSGQPAS
jgi:uncharacterized protein